MTVSFQEQLLYEYFHWLMPDRTIIQDDRQALHGKELDLWFPDDDKAIEIGVWALHKDVRKNDRNKRVSAARRGIKLLSLFTGHKEVNGLSKNSPLVWHTSVPVDVRIKKTAFLEFVKPVCEEMDFQYREPSNDEWNVMKSAAVAKRDSDKQYNIPEETEENIPMDSTPVTDDTMQPQQTTTPTDTQLDVVRYARSIRSDWVDVYALLATTDNGMRHTVARQLIDSVFPVAAGVDLWPKDTLDVMAEHAKKRMKSSELIGKSLNMTRANNALVGGLDSAYRQYLDEVESVTAAMAAIRNPYVVDVAPEVFEQAGD